MFNLESLINKDKVFKQIKPYLKRYECYLVGGYLRDLIMGETSFDRDLIVKSNVSKKLAKTIADSTGGYFVPLDEKNRIYRVVMADKVNYLDISAMLDDNLDKDIKRRDLTINSLVYDVNKECVIDNANALKDFETGILRTVFMQNFIDDPLRMLRVFRFQAKYNFKIDDEIIEFVKNNLKLIQNPAKERINLEIMKLFEGKYSDVALKSMHECGLLSAIFPVVDELITIPPNSHHHLNLLNHSIECVRQIERNIKSLAPEIKTKLDETTLGAYSRRAFLKLAGFFHDIGKPDTWTIEEETGRHRFIMHDELGSQKIIPIMKDLKFSKKQVAYVQQMIKFHIYPSSLVWQEGVGSKPRLKFYRKMYPFFVDVIILAMSDRLSALGPVITHEIVVRNLADLSILLQECIDIDNREANPKPLLTGNDIMRLTSLPQSKQLGDVVKSLYQAQLDGEICTQSEAESFVKRNFQQK